MPQVILQQLTPHPAQRLLHRLHLGQHVGTVTLVLDHALEAAHLALDAAEPVEYGLLGFGVDVGVTASVVMSDPTAVNGKR